MEAKKINIAFEQCQKLHRKGCRAYHGAWFGFSGAILQQRFCSWRGNTLPTATTATSVLGSDSQQRWQGVWVGNHLGITMEPDRLAPMELLYKERGKGGPFSSPR